MSTVDPIVEEYLRRLDQAAAGLPPDRRSDLLEEIGEHIAVARSSGAAQDEAAVRDVLQRLGEPAEIVAAAQEDAVMGWGTPGPYTAEWPAPPPVLRPRGTGLELTAVVLLTAGSIVPLVGWLVGVVLLWSSSLWRVREKLLGTLVIPLGPGGLLFTYPLLLSQLGRSETCSSTGASRTEGTGADVTVCEVSGFSDWVAVPVALVLLAAPIVVAVLLHRIATRRAAAAPSALAPPYGPAPSPWGPLELSAVLLLGVGGFVLPVVGGLAGLVLACVSPRWRVRDKLVAGALAVSPAVVLLASFLLPAPGSFAGGPGGQEVFLLLLVAGPLASGYLSFVLQRRVA